jgi:hypothetical protein
LFVIEELLPLPNHAQMTVVQDHCNNRNVVLDYSYKLLGVHLKRAVSCNVSWQEVVGIIKSRSIPYQNVIK